MNLSKHKLVFLGDQGVGKTSIINRFIFDVFDEKSAVKYYDLANNWNRFY
jgi:GTPase SAR1 family protein